MNQAPPQPVAFFDFDGTLTWGDTLMPFLRFAVGAPAYYARLAWLSPVLGAYAAGLLRNDIAKQIVLKRYLAGHAMAELQACGRRFAAEAIPAMLCPSGMAQLDWHQARGHECVLVSASLDIYLAPWAAQAGFSRVICSSLAQTAHGRVTGRLAGRNCHGAEKARRIAPLVARAAPATTYAYGDTEGDLPMLQLVETGLMRRKRRRPPPDADSADVFSPHCWQRIAHVSGTHSAE
ncbi:HAD-IB family hydrolase [Halomonas piscis]|uniref:HAD-IB family hydrolase n=1 Tax=Halomonas piscis TaxID=3031727 RepID=A0ABY9Z255_9GAMM|nr:HAD family hydrolase [Halomonas piscis]WNK21224.1 HAD-IB family hydrolase [Halomonas piscis]